MLFNIGKTYYVDANGQKQPFTNKLNAILTALASIASITIRGVKQLSSSFFGGLDGTPDFSASWTGDAKQVLGVTATEISIYDEGLKLEAHYAGTGDPAPTAQVLVEWSSTTENADAGEAIGTLIIRPLNDLDCFKNPTARLPYYVTTDLVDESELDTVGNQCPIVDGPGDVFMEMNAPDVGISVDQVQIDQDQVSPETPTQG